MRSSLVARLILIGCILFPEAALGRLVPVYVWREFPTSSPTSSPSYQPSAQPSSEPTLHPSLAPSTSMKPSHRPSSTPSYSPSYQPSISTQPSSQVTSTLLRASNLADSDRMANPSSRGLVLIVSIVSVVAILLCFVCVGFRRYRQSKSVKYDDDQDLSQTSSDGDQESQSDEESQNSAEDEDGSVSISSAKTDISNPRPSNIDEAHVNDGLNISNIGYALSTRFQRAIDTLTTQNRHVHFNNKKKVQVFHIAEEPGMITYDSGPEDNSNEPPTPTRPSTPVPRRPPTPILRPSTPRPATPILR